MSRKPFENDGRFYPGHVSPVETPNRASRRRVLCFVTHHGVVGASASFSRAEAYHAAVRAERGQLPLPVASTPGPLIARLLAQRGFPVHDANDCVDETTAEFILREFSA